MMDDFTLADVYEHAAKIGQDIEQLIRNYGEGSVEELMPKIVFTLEQLEGLADRRQKDMAKINELNAEKERLSIECKKESAYRRQADEKIEYMETMMNEDTKSLQNKIKVLLEENEILKSDIEELDEEVATQRKRALPGDVDLMVKMKTTIDSQRDEIREVKQENERHKSEIDALNEQTNRLTDMNERLRIYNEKLQDRLAETIQHKVQAESTLAAVKIVNGDSNADAKPVIGMEKEETSREQSTMEVNEPKKEGQNAEKNEELNGIVLVPEKEQEATEKDVKINDKPAKEQVQNKEERKNSDNKTADDNAGKEQVVVKKDPNRPRYTLAEMQQVLEERNRYKERVSTLEDALEAYIPGPVRSSTLDKDDEQLKKRQTLKGTPKRDSKVRGIFGSFWKGGS